MKNPVLIIGAKGLGAVALEIFKSNDVVVYGMLDEDEKTHGTEIDFVGVLGAPDDDGFLKLIGQKCESFVAIEDNSEREKYIKLLKDRRKVIPTNAIHNNVKLGTTIEIGHGNLLNSGCTVNTQSKIGSFNVIQSGTIIEHGVKISDYCYIGAGSIIGAGAQIANEVQIGAGCIISPGIKIGKGAKVVSGSLVVKNVDAEDTVFGVPAKTIE
jgi:sugar O-acyltransferase (sialic acid O-acetyltransferase NeuD family)